MENNVTTIIWKREQHSDIYRSTIINSSLLREGQKIKVIPGKTRKEHMAVVDCYPLKVEVQQTFTRSELLPRQTRAKRKLLSVRSTDCF